MAMAERDSEERGGAVCVVGAGLVGSLLAVYLARRGWRVDLYEKRLDLRCTDSPGGRSIVMSLSDRGWRGLAGVGLDGEIRATTLPKRRRLVHAPDGSVLSQSYGGPLDAIWTVDRKLLNCRLLDAAAATGRVRLHFAHECRALEPHTGRVEFADLAGGGAVKRRYDRVVGADGIFSRVRGALAEGGHVRDELQTLDFGYRELTIPAGPDGRWALASDAVHVWPRPNSLLIALPNRNGTFTCMLIMRREGEISLLSVRAAADFQALLDRHFADVAPLMPNAAAEYLRRPASSIFTVRCDPWHATGRVVLMGDACHAIAPFYAMGMNMGFEDVTTFTGLLDRHGDDWAAAVAAFGAARKPDTDAIAALSLRNFNAIGQSTGQDFQAKWEIERRIWELAPERWRPLYAMIAFSHAPLSQVVAAHERQEQIVATLIERHGVDRPDHPGLPALLAALLPPAPAAPTVTASD